MERMAFNFEGALRGRNMTNFMAKSKCDDRGLLSEYQQSACALLNHQEAMITGDGSDFPKQGNHSVGTGRQYCGSEGKVDNCQAGVFMGIASPIGYALLDFELYLQEQWFREKFAELRKKCGVPENLEFQTKNQLLLTMITNLENSGLFKGKYVGVDSSFGRDHEFLDALPQRLVYFADVPNNHLVFLGRPEMLVPQRSGRGRKPGPAPSFPPIKVKDLADDPAFPWQDVVLGNGAKGPIFAKDKCLKVVEYRDGKPGKDVWLYVRMLEDGSIKYSLCNESMDATLEMIRAPALMRWSIEQCFKECKNNLGMDHFMARSWTALRRHMLFTFITHLFLTKLRIMFSVKIETPGPAPVVTAPTPLEEYREAVIQAENDEPITHKNIVLFPEEPQQILTIGLIQMLIQPFLPKVGEVWNKVKEYLKNAYAAYSSHTKAKIAKLKLKEIELAPGLTG
jgi:SRSO17 transposase